MSTNRRTIYYLRTLLPIALALTLGTVPAVSQKRERARREPATQNDDASRARRIQALALLVETADQARLFDDLFYRARVQSLAADALWPHDVRQARAIFRRAWEAATASDKAEQEESERQVGTLSGVTPDFSEARLEVLRIAAARDTRLAEAFLRELVGKKNDGDMARNEQSRNNVLRRLTEQRLALAAELLEAGETRRAAEIAALVVDERPSRDGMSVDLIVFILRLRRQNVSEADALYLRLLQRAAADPQTDANDVLLLSSPVVSPSLLVIIDDFGFLQFRALPRTGTNSAPEQVVPQRTLEAFFRLAASVLSRSRGPRASLAMQELMAQFYATGRLLPYFENPSSPWAAHAPALRARHSELFNEIESSRREQFSAQFSVNSLTPAGFVDPLRSEAEQLFRTSDSAERRRLAQSIIRTAVRNRFWDRARRATADLEDGDERRAALSFIQVQQIKDLAKTYADENEDDFESVVTFVRKAEAPPVAKAWGLAQAAIIAGRRRDAQTSQKVAELISEAEENAARVSQGTAARVAAYGIVTTAAARVAPSRAWELLREFVKAANAIEDFLGDEVAFDMAVEEPLPVEPTGQYGVGADIFRCDAIFATMADLDFDKALEEARVLDGDVPQAFAVIAITRSLLDKQKSGRTTPKAQ